MGFSMLNVDAWMSYGPTDTMDKWDEEKLRSVILSKHGNPRTTTEVLCPSSDSRTSFDSFPTSSLPFKIVCKHFIEAVETQK